MKLYKDGLLLREEFIDGKRYTITAFEDNTGLYIEDTKKNKKVKIGNFILRYDRPDRNENEGIIEIRHRFYVYFLKERKKIYTQSKQQVFHVAGEKSKRDIENQLDRQARLENQDRDTLEYLGQYMIKLENIGNRKDKIEENHNEHIKEQVKRFIVDWIQSIDGKEDEFLENGYDENDELKKVEWEEKGIKSNKDIFLYNRAETHKGNKDIDDSNKKVEYNKIGFVEKDYTGQKLLYYYIHLPTLKEYMRKLELLPEEMTSEKINTGLNGLGLLRPCKDSKEISHSCKMPNGKHGTRCLCIYVDKLLKMAYPDSEEIKNSEIINEKETKILETDQVETEIIEKNIDNNCDIDNYNCEFDEFDNYNDDIKDYSNDKQSLDDFGNSNLKTNKVFQKLIQGILINSEDDLEEYLSSKKNI